MKKTVTLLQTIFWCGLALSAVTALFFEIGLLEAGSLAGQSQQTEFIFTTLLELFVLAIVPTALKLFKFNKVHQQLVSRKSEALRAWGSLRLTMLELPLIVNICLYYIYMNVAFGYMAIILLICLPFVYPSNNRCIAETEE